jgi:hypothetical protein
MEPTGAEQVGAVDGTHSKKGKGQFHDPAFCGSEQPCPKMHKNLNASWVRVDQNALSDQFLPAVKTQSKKDRELIMAQRDLWKVPEPQDPSQEQDQPEKVLSGFLFHLHKINSIHGMKWTLPERDE